MDAQRPLIHMRGSFSAKARIAGQRPLLNRRSRLGDWRGRVGHHWAQSSGRETRLTGCRHLK
jgi:hypothetical protein